MRTERNGSKYSIIHDTWDSYVNSALSHYHELGRYAKKPEFCGVKDKTELEDLAWNGWSKEQHVTLKTAEEAVAKVEQEVDMMAMTSYHDMVGAEVDMALYLEGDPECMIEYEIVEEPKPGRVITLCASISYSCAVSKESMKKRGHLVAALALAMDKLGYQTELWADMTLSPKGGGSTRLQERVLVKSPKDLIDPARLLYAYAHPSMVRNLGFGAGHDAPKGIQNAVGIGSYYGVPVAPFQDLPEGTIYLPEVRTGQDVPNADKELYRYMKQLGIVNE